MRRLREKTMLEAEITTSGDVTVEGQHIGHLHGFHFVPDPQADTAEAKTLRNAASKALAGEIGARADRFAEAADTTLVLSNDGTIRWMGDPVARLEPGDRIFDPRDADPVRRAPGGSRPARRSRRACAPGSGPISCACSGRLLELETSQELTGLARGIAFQIVESLGVLERSKVLNDVRSLDQDARGASAQGRHSLWRVPSLSARLAETRAAHIWRLSSGRLQNGGLDQKGIDEIAHLAQSGRTSIPVDAEISAGLYRAAGFRICGGRAVRVDILERLADLIRPAISYRPGITPGEPPAGTADGDGFIATVAMTSLVGCAGEDFATILKSLGYSASVATAPPSRCRWSLARREVEQPAVVPETNARRFVGGRSEAQPEAAPKVRALPKAQVEATSEPVRAAPSISAKSPLRQVDQVSAGATLPAPWPKSVEAPGEQCGRRGGGTDPHRGLASASPPRGCAGASGPGKTRARGPTSPAR